MDAPMRLTIPVPLPDGQLVTVTGVFPVTAEAWEHLMAVLDAMRPGLTDEEGA